MGIDGGERGRGGGIWVFEFILGIGPSLVAAFSLHLLFTGQGRPRLLQIMVLWARRLAIMKLSAVCPQRSRSRH